MKNIITLAILATLQLFVSCTDDSNNSYYNNPCFTELPYTEQMDESGLRYVILEEGEGGRPTVDSTVNVTYRGTLLENNNLFDENTDGIELPLYAVIDGWKIGIPLIKEGGKIMLYIPSLLGYGCQGGGTTIPSNANLIFEVEIIEII